ncbi:MAG: hypothetical protein ACRD3V_23415 [Vicinamibacteria bacterium]
MSGDFDPNEIARRPPFHGRQLIVDRAFQYRLIGTLLALWLATSLFFSSVFYFFYQGHLLRFYDLVPRPGTLPLLSVETVFTLSIAFVSAFGFVVLFLLAIYMSNQIAGPLYRTKKALDRAGRGDWSFALQFRHSDFLHDIPKVFNAMLEALRQQAEAEVEELKAIEAAAGNPAECRGLARRQRERKEAQLGIGIGNGGMGADPETVSLVVH